MNLADEDKGVFMPAPRISPIDLKKAKADFDRDGYCVIRQFLNEVELAELRGELDHYVSIRVPQLPATDAFYEIRTDPKTLKQLAHMKQNDPYFFELIRRKKWTRLARELLSDEVVPQELEWFNKPPLIGKPTPPHQDGHYFMLEPNEAVTMWLALDDVDESNGCMRYIAGSHRQGLRPHAKTYVLGFSQGISDYGSSDFAAETPICGKPGDLLVHHSLTIHRADGNPSPRHRRSLGFVYYAASARQDSGRLAEYQQGLYKELAESKRI
jgi:phytanoyl-CoA hydroxylase